MSSNELEAKEIFMKYGGEYSVIGRDGLLELYRSFAVSKNLELEWVKELEADLLKHLIQNLVVDSDAIKLFGLIINYNRFEAYSNVLNVIENNLESLDSFTIVRLGEEILNVVSICENFKSHKSEALSRSKLCLLKLLDLVKYRPITVHPYYKNIPYLMDILDDKNLYQRIAGLDEKTKFVGK